MLRLSMRGLFTLSCIGIITSQSQHSASARRLGEDSSEPCPEITTDVDFNAMSLESYVSKKWFVHEQAVTTYLPVERNYCVTAEYSLLQANTLWGYSIVVNNKAKNLQGEDFGGILYAAQTDPVAEPAKLEVAPGFLPRFLAGPYWILEYQEEDVEGGQEGYALIVGGQPNVRIPGGGCRTQNRFITSSGGLWIFTRSPDRNDTLIDEIKRNARTKHDLDVSVLNPVNHTAIDCGYA